MKVVISQRHASLLLYAAFLAASVAAYSFTGNFPSPLLPGYPGSAMFPRLVLIAMGIVCLWGLAGTLLAPRIPGAGRSVEIPLVGFAAIMAMLVSFAVMLTTLGLEVAVLVMIGVTIWLRTRSLLIAAVSAVSATAAIYLVFVQLLSVPLPLTFLPRYMLGY